MVKKGPGRPTVYTDEEALEALNQSKREYKAKRKRIDMVVDPKIEERWQRYLADVGCKREEALSRLLTLAGF